jgi:hypothetical protein
MTDFEREVMELAKEYNIEGVNTISFAHAIREIVVEECAKKVKNLAQEYRRPASSRGEEFARVLDTAEAAIRALTKGKPE